MSPEDPIAEGRTAEVFPLENGRVLKLYRAGYPRSAAQSELVALRWARQLGLPVPEPGAVVKRNGRWGFDLARVDGLNGMARILSDVVGAEEEAVALAGLQVRVNACAGGRLPERRSLLGERIDRLGGLSRAEKASLRRVLKDLPTGDRLLHGDMHPGNVVWSASGPVVIDWVDASRGVPVADVARSLVLFRCYSASLPEDDPRTKFTRAYLAAYRELSGDPLDRLDDWVLVTAAARIAEGAAEGDEELREFVRRGV